MKLVDLIDMAQTVAPEINPNDVVIRVNASYADLAAEVDCQYASASFVLAEPQSRFLWSDFNPSDPEEEPVAGRLSKLLGVSINGIEIRHLHNATAGDLCYIEDDHGFHAGQYQGKNNASHRFGKFPEGAEVGIYYAQPPYVTLATETLPLPEFHGALVYKVRSDLHADRSEWDRVGYYLRRYRESYERAKRTLRANRGVWNVQSTRI